MQLEYVQNFCVASTFFTTFTGGNNFRNVFYTCIIISNANTELELSFNVYSAIKV